jgi:hypothetical protein
MKKIIIASLLAVGLSGSAFAAVNSDLILGFTNDGSVNSNGQSVNLEIDLGQVSQFQVGGAYAGGGTFNVLDLTSLGANAIGAVYGSDFATNTGLTWAVVGTSGNTTTTRTLWATQTAPTSVLDGVASTAGYIGKASLTQATPAAKIVTYYNGLTSSSAQIATTFSGSWKTTDAALTFFNPVTQLSSTVGTASDLYQVAAVANQAGTFLGTFDITSSGELTFSTAIPEPSTYAAILGAAVLGFVALRRRRSVSA